MSLNIVDKAGTLGVGASPTMQKQRLFEAFAEANPGAIRAMEAKAVSLDKRGLHVSAKYLVEWLRYESGIRINRVRYETPRGTRSFALNNVITPYLARWLKERHPEMRIEIRRGHDGVTSDG